MLPEIFLEQYRLSRGPDREPVEIGRNGSAVTYRAADLRSGAPVALTLIPISSVDPVHREEFEEKARTAMLLDHMNIAKTIAFGTADNYFAVVAECPQGETVQSWVTAYGPMPPDAVLRVGLQVVAALSSASFHGLTHPAIQPSSLVIVSGVILTGKTAAGGWPFVKLTQFALAGLKAAPRAEEPDISASDYASPEQLLQGRVDFPSEIYSLGATMCFLLMGVFYSAYPRSPQTRRFARPLRTLIARTLEEDPSRRPQDPVLFTEELRTCLAAVEQRQAWQRRFGLPFRAVNTKPLRRPVVQESTPTSLLAEIGAPAPALAPVVVRRSRARPIWAVIGCLLVGGLIGALLLPEDVVTRLFHRKKPIEAIGVPVGVPVPESSAPAIVQSNTSTSVPQAGANVKSAAPQPATARPATAAAPPPDQPATRSIAATNPQPATPAPVIAAEQNSTATAPETAAAKPNTSSPTKPAEASTPAALAFNSESEPQAQTSTHGNVTPVEAPSPPAKNVSSPAVAATPAVVASNNAPAEPTPPAEAPAEAQPAPPPPAAAPGIQPQPESAQREVAAATPAPSEKRSSASPSGTSKSRSKKSPTDRQRFDWRHVPRALPAEPDLPPAHSGTMNARVVGVTPAGNVILELPNGERAIVAPQDAKQYSTHRRVRRVIIERRPIFVPPQFGPYQTPYQPFIPPDA